MEGTFTLTVEMGNDAMRTPVDLADAVAAVARRVAVGERVGDVRDLNGNTVGNYEFVEGE